jgi:hypothetical protein
MSCETCLEKVEAFYKSEDPNLKGILIITDFRIAFKFYFDTIIDRLGYGQDYFNIPLFCINKIEKAHEKKNFKRYTLELFLKDSRQIKFVIVSDHIKFYHRINELIISNSPNTFYQFAEKYNDSNIEFMVQGWDKYDPKEEYMRQGVTECEEYFQLVTNNYAICQTYPKEVYIPKKFPLDDLREASNFRTKNRFPVFSYLYKTKMDKKYPSIWRSSQTKTGLTQNRSTLDESLLRCIGELADKVIIYDARPYLSALANRVS